VTRPKAIRIGMALTILFAWLAVSSGPASGTCIGPSLFVLDAKFDPNGSQAVHVGETVTVGGRYWYTHCNDTPGPCEQGGMSGPMQDVEIGIAPARVPEGKNSLWERAGPVVPLGAADADEHGEFTIEGAVMPTEPGPYLLVYTTPSTEDLFGSGWVWVR
jgi:hypothetical protein